MQKSISIERRTPSFSAGWCISNAHNRYKQIGSYKLFLVKKDTLTVSVDIRRRITKLTCNSVKLFNINELMMTFVAGASATTWGKSSGNNNWEWVTALKIWNCFLFFLSEGFSLISEFLIAFHKDVLNDPSPSHSITYSLKAWILLIPEMMLLENPISKLATALGPSSGDVLPISLMIYPRKSVGDYCLKQSKIAQCLCGDAPGDIGPLVQRLIVGVMNVLQEDHNYSSKWDKSKHMFQKLKMSSESFKPFAKKDYGTVKKGDLRR